MMATTPTSDYPGDLMAAPGTVISLGTRRQRHGIEFVLLGLDPNPTGVVAPPIAGSTPVGLGMPA